MHAEKPVGNDETDGPVVSFDPVVFVIPGHVDGIRRQTGHVVHESPAKLQQPNKARASFSHIDMFIMRRCYAVVHLAPEPGRAFGSKSVNSRPGRSFPL